MNIITWWMILPPRRGRWFLSTGRAEMGVISEQDLDGLIAEIGVGLKPGTVRAQTRTEIGTLIAVAKRGDPRRVTRDGDREGFEPVFKHAVALLKAIESDPHQRVKFALCHFLDGMEPRVPSRSGEFFRTLWHVADFARKEMRNTLRDDSVYRPRNWEEHLIGILMRVDFEKYFKPVGHSIQGPFPRFVKWIFEKAGPDEKGNPRTVSDAAIKNAVEMCSLFSESDQIPETVKRRAQQRLQTAEKQEPRARVVPEDDQALPEGPFDLR
jgi:hypothetical protein